MVRAGSRLSDGWRRRRAQLARFVTAAATIGAWFAAAPALAGLKPIDGQPTPAMAVAEAYAKFLTERAPGMVEPLIDYAAETLPAAKCDAAQKPRVHALLIGSSRSGEPFGNLRGPENDVDLLAASLLARGVADDDIVLLVDDYGTREQVGAFFRETIGRVNCGDHLLLHFGGNASTPRLLIDTLAPDELRQQRDKLTADDYWDSDHVNAGHEPTRRMRRAEGAGLFLALNQQREGVLDLVSADDLSDFATVLRNRQVDVTVTLDTSYASAADLAGRQGRAGDTVYWSLEATGGGADDAGPTVKDPVLTLAPLHGEFAVFYSSVGDSHAMEIDFVEPDGSKVNYGVFSFSLATVMQNRDTVTIRALGESLKSAPGAEGAAPQRYRVEASDPDLAMFTDGSLNLPQTDPIVITKPSPKRGAAAVEKAEVDIEGEVNWSSPTKAVLVNGKVASLEGSRFRHTATLKAGLNTVEIVALTGDGRTHERRLEFMFEGDKKALEGDGARYAVIIANETYDRQKSGFEALKTPFEDADAVAAILTGKYGFTTEAKLPDGSAFTLFLKDATRRDIETVLYKIGLVAGEKDTVLIYFAGHGIYEEKTTIAFWVPSDAEAGVPISYLSASTIAESVQRMQANKVILISDSCFSGALLRGGGDSPPKIEDAERERALLRLSQRRTRILISSGNNEPVEDQGGAGHSIFARALLTGLEDMAHDAFSARELYDGYILPLVIANADQEPQYRPIDRSGHEGGDVVFVRQQAR